MLQGVTARLNLSPSLENAVTEGSSVSLFAERNNAHTDELLPPEEIKEYRSKNK